MSVALLQTFGFLEKNKHKNLKTVDSRYIGSCCLQNKLLCAVCVCLMKERNIWIFFMKQKIRLTFITIIIFFIVISLQIYDKRLDVFALAIMCSNAHTAHVNYNVYAVHRTMTTLFIRLFTLALPLISLRHFRLRNVIGLLLNSLANSNSEIS